MDYSYLIYDKSNNIYKIGKSIDPIKRFKQHQTSNVNLELIGVSVLKEYDLHKLFNENRINTEWFDIPKCKLEPLKYLFKDEVDVKLLNKTEESYFNEGDYKQLKDVVNNFEDYGYNFTNKFIKYLQYHLKRNERRVLNLDGYYSKLVCFNAYESLSLDF